MLHKHCKNVLAIAGACTSMLFTGCIDDEYDLDNVDSTMQFEINDLALPLNLEPVQFDDLVDLTSEECIEVFNGEYVLKKTGSFESKAIKIGAITATIHSQSESVFNQHFPAIYTPDGNNDTHALPLDSYTYDFDYKYDEVDESIRDIISGEVDMHLYLEITAVYDNGKPIDCTFPELTLSLPKGFYGDVNGVEISEVTGNLITMENCGVNNEGQLIIDFHVDRFVTADAGAEVDAPNFYLSTGFGIVDGSVRFKNGTGEPGRIGMEFRVSELEIKKVTGIIDYKLEDLNPENLELNDLPDELKNKNTNLVLKNPQLYVRLQNPLSVNNVTASTSLVITQIRDGIEQPNPATLSEDLVITAESEPQEFCLSPVKPTSFAPDFQNSKHIAFSGLANVVSGAGLPDALKIDFKDASIPARNVADPEIKNLVLGEEIGEIKGDYTFFAPLELGQDAKIEYSSEATGWGIGGNDDEQMVISQLAIDADVLSELPVSVELKAQPLNSEGQPIPGVESPHVVIAAGQQQPITIKMSGDIRDLDGMKYTIFIKAGKDASSLKPTQKLILKNLKVRVSGKLIVDSDDNE